MSGLIHSAEFAFASVASFITIGKKVSHVAETDLTNATNILHGLCGGKRYERRQYFYYDSAAAIKDDTRKLATDIETNQDTDQQGFVDTLKRHIGHYETLSDTFHLNLVGLSDNAAQYEIGSIPFTKTREKILQLHRRTCNASQTQLESVVIISVPRFGDVSDQTFADLFRDAMRGTDGMKVSDIDQNYDSLKRARGNVIQ